MNRTWIVSPAVLAALWALNVSAANPPPDDLLELTPAQVQGLALKFVGAADAGEYLIATLPAVIAPPPNARVAVAATFPGIVLQTLAVEGDAVRRGQPLAIIASREVLTLSADLASARARLAVASANAKRQDTLSKEGIVAGARAEEAVAALQEARAELNEKSRVLEAVNADGAKGTYTLTAPIDGAVASSKIETGAPVDGMTAAFVVDATDRYEVQAQVPERLVGKIAPGMRVAVDGTIEAKVTSVGKAVQPGTRSAALKATIANGTGLVAGRTTMASVYAPASAGAVKVPRAAVAEVDGETVVFARAAGGVAVRKVATAPIRGPDVVIMSGLKAGEEVAVSNVSELKSMALAK